MAASTEARELELVGKVEMRIALAKDDKLESVLKPYLPPLLLKLASDHQSVRNKVISTCQHIKIRLAGNKDIVLPVAALLKQYKEHPESSMIRHFDLMFIQQSIGKLSSSEQMDLIPTLIHGLAGDADKPTCATVFNLFLRLLPQLRVPSRGSKEDTELRHQLGLDEHQDDAKFLASWFGKLILLTIVRAAPSGVTCPGLSVKEYEFLTLTGKQETWDPSSDEGLNLTQTKITVLNFLASGAFTDEERFLPALFASADSNSRISGIGDDLLKRSAVSLEDAELVHGLLGIYFSLKPALQTRVLVLLTKSAISTTFPREIVKIVQEGIQPNDNTNVPAPGLETIKFRNALFNYMNWVSRMGSINDLSQVAPQLVGFLRTYIEDQGWPVPHERSSDAAALRALAYETLGALAKTTPSIVLEEDLSLIRWLFRSLTEEGSSDDIFVSIEGALASLLSAFAAPLPTKIRDELRLLLLKYMTLQEGDEIVRSARFSTVRWANRCLEYSDIVARWIDILALSARTDERSDVVEEGAKGLDPYWYRLLNSTSASAECPLPEWDEMIKVFFGSQILVENSNIANTMKTGMEVDSISVFGNFSGTRVNAFPAAINYSRRMLLLRALEKTDTPLGIDADWERQLDVLYRSDKDSRKAMKAHILTVDEDSLHVYLTAAFEGMLRNDGNGLAECGKCFVEIASIAPSKAIGRLADRAIELVPCIRSNNVATRFLAAQAMGILLAHPAVDDSSIESLIQTLASEIEPWETAVGAEANKVHGSIVTLGYVLSRVSYYGRDSFLSKPIITKLLSQFITILEGVRDASTKEAILNAISQTSASGVLTVDVLKGTSLGVDETVKILLAEAKKGNEKAISTLGRLSIMFDESDDQAGLALKTIITGLYDLFELKQPEIHFTIGEALSCVGACWDSDVLKLSLDVDVNYDGRKARPATFENIIQKLLTDCKTTKPSLKKASGIWLFCLIQYSGHLEQIQTQLRECQAAFMGLLSAREEIVQETASRGLSLVYEQGDKELRERLVKDLVASFTGTSTQLKVHEETELFEPGALPTGEGKSITSYKDIVSLANEVGDQSLVYKFMSLATNAATWSTRAAFGRFGLSNILSESEIDPKLYPKLYRYRFDPNPNVQRSMNDIWSALVKDSNATINQYFDEILSDLLKSILGKEWRTREASCAAIADLVQGREFEKYEKHLHDIWHVAFKVLDDIKGSVRKAALSLSMALTGILVRQVEAGTSSKHAQAMLKDVLPFLLSDQGLESSAKEVQTFATITVLKLIKSGGKALLPYVPHLVETMINLLSTLEPEGVDYLYLRAAHYNLTEEKIDSARSSAVTQSPLMEAIERCLDIIDESTMKELVPRLENVIKTTVGMPSKVGCGGILVSLATRHSLVFRPHADHFLKILEKSVLDRNNAVSASYARAAGYLSRVASDEAILRLLTYSKELYFNADDENRRQVSSDIIYASSKFATDRFNSMSSDFLPFVFFAKHDLDDATKKQFGKTWDENVGGSRAVLLYAREINGLVLQFIDSPKWTIKHSAALTIADVVMSVTSTTSTEMDSPTATLIWPALEKALALKTFTGKEKVLQAFNKFINTGSSLWKADSAIAAHTKKIAIREAKRNNDAYRPFAFASLGEYAEARTDLDMWDEVYSIIVPFLEDITSEDKMETSTDSKKDSAGEKSDEAATITAGITALFRAINLKFLDPPPVTHLPKLLKTVQPVLKSANASVATRAALYERVKTLFEGLRKGAHEQKGNSYPVCRGFVEILEVESGAGSEGLRIKRGEAAKEIVEALRGGVFGNSGEGRKELVEWMRGVLGEALSVERNESVKTVWVKVVKLLEGE
ncbi:proteasome component protein [Rutstroemia sp. NJR-2017a BVV2]|nr:proteasome component protein [Rutstroemia sp. NJR-2017a BVV2]